jgi:hypothetical protein
MDLVELMIFDRALTADEYKQAEGYARHPVEPGEFDGWEEEQAWGEP